MQILKIWNQFHTGRSNTKMQKRRLRSTLVVFVLYFCLSSGQVNNLFHFHPKNLDKMKKNNTNITYVVHMFEVKVIKFFF